MHACTPPRTYIVKCTNTRHGTDDDRRAGLVERNCVMTVRSVVYRRVVMGFRFIGPSVVIVVVVIVFRLSFVVCRLLSRARGREREREVGRNA